MNNTFILERAKKLGLYGLIAHWPSLGETIPIAELIDWEETERIDRGLKLRIKHAKLGHFKLLSDFDWEWPTQCDREQIESVLEMDFVKNAVNIILLGPNGVGKTTLAINILYQSILNGHKGLYVTASQMLNDFNAQDGNMALNKRLKYYATPSVLVVDELGYLSYSNAHADLLFEVISRRYKKKPTIITTNKPFSEWDTIFPNASCVVSLIDRLIHASEMIQIEGASYRLKEAKEASVERQKIRHRKKGKPVLASNPESSNNNQEFMAFGNNQAAENSDEVAPTGGNKPPISLA